MKHPVWHPDLHQVKLRSSLYFIFLSSYGDFREFSKDVLKHFNAEYPDGFSFYYVYGNFDLVIRIWLDHTEAQALQKRLKELLRPFSGTIDIFNVDAIHYLWCEPYPDHLDEGILLDAKVQTRHIKGIQEGTEEIDPFFITEKIILDIMESRPPDNSGKIKSFILFDFGTTSSNVFSILQEELISKLRREFADDHVTVYFGHGAGTMLIKQLADSISRLSAIGEFVRRELSLLRARSSTYVVGRVLCESDNANLNGKDSNVNLHLPEQVQMFVSRYPEARRLPPDSLFIAFSINVHAEEAIRSYPLIKRPYNTLIKGVVSSDRGTLINAVISVGEVIQNEFHQIIPKIGQQAFGDDWETTINNVIIKQRLEKSKPWQKLSLGELLGLIRELNSEKMLDDEVASREWENKISDFIFWRNKAAHDTNHIDLPRVYEISMTFHRAAHGLQALCHAVETYVDV